MECGMVLIIPVYELLIKIELQCPFENKDKLQRKNECKRSIKILHQTKL